MNEFFYLASEVRALLAHFSVVTSLVIFGWVVGLITTGSRLREHPLRLASACLIPDVLPFGILVIAVAFPFDGNQLNSSLTQIVIIGFLLAHLPVTGLLVWRFSSQWPIVLGSSCVWLWVSIGAWLVASRWGTPI